MKKTLSILICAILWLNTNAQVIPEHKTDSYVNDFANVIDDSKEQILDKKIRDFKTKSSIEITIVSINSLDGADVDSYSNNLFRKWGIGTKELNNGLLILFSVSDRKWRIEIGDGLEEYMTDGYARIEAKNVLVPYFKSKDYFAGVNALLDDFITKLGPIAWDQRVALKKKQVSEAKQQEEAFASGLITFFTWFAIIAMLAVVIGIYVRNEKKKKEKLEEEAREKKRRLEQLISDNNSSINEFSRMMLWAKDNKRLFAGQFARVINFDDFDHAKRKLDDLFTQRSLNIDSMESEKILIRNITQDLLSQIRDVYVASVELSTIKSSIREAIDQCSRYKSSIETTTTNHKRMLDTFGISIVDMEFPKAALTNKLAGIESALQVMSNKNSLDDLQSLKKEFKDVQTKFKEISNPIEMVNKRIDYINNAIQFVSSNRGKINSLLHDAQRKIKDSDVEYSTKSKFNTVKAKAEMFQENKNPLIAYEDMSTLINDLNSVIRKATDDINEAERKRRREEEEREEESRRAAAIISSSMSSSSYSSSSSNDDNSSSFGGGSSSGGGASGDW